LPTVSSIDEAADLLRAATAGGRRIRIGTDLATGGMDRILEHEAGDLTCTVEAGIRLSVLNAELTRHRQRLAIDPPGDPTIGACLAGNLSGPLRHRWGTIRDLVLGVTLVLADGTVVNAGGKVVKNVAGYDLGKLVCGSQGKLALIARVSLRLHPIAEARGSLVAKTDDPADAVAAIAESQLVPSALDVLHPGRVAVMFEGSDAAVASQIEQSCALVGGEPAGLEPWEEARRRQASARGRLRFAPGKLRNTLAALDEAIVRPAAGVAYVPQPVADDTPAPVLALQERLRHRFDPAGVLQ
jgi:glycolate oxidase FAD binding subunit